MTETAEKSVRKRKLKPHAVQYLQSKKDEPVEKIDEQSVERTNKKPIDLLIEKNLIKKNPSKSLDSSEKSNDTDYVNDDNEELMDEDDDDYDYDQDFKMKCQQNLKLSKKLKKSSVKHQKDLQNDDQTKKYKTNGVTPSAIGASSLPNKSSSTNSSSVKKFKKGFATSKQRLGKLLKINRIVNI